MARKPEAKEPALTAQAPAPPNPALAIAARYSAMTDAQIHEVMHGYPAQMLADLRALCDGVKS